MSNWRQNFIQYHDRCSIENDNQSVKIQFEASQRKLLPSGPSKLIYDEYTSCWNNTNCIKEPTSTLSCTNVCNNCNPNVQIYDYNCMYPNELRRCIKFASFHNMTSLNACLTYSCKHGMIPDSDGFNFLESNKPVYTCMKEKLESKDFVG